MPPPMPCMKALRLQGLRRYCTINESSSACNKQLT